VTGGRGGSPSHEPPVGPTGAAGKRRRPPLLRTRFPLQIRSCAPKMQG
jgi:hypothetical protein